VCSGSRARVRPSCSVMRSGRGGRPSGTARSHACSRLSERPPPQAPPPPLAPTSLPRSTSRGVPDSSRGRTCPWRSAGPWERCRRSSRTPPTSPAPSRCPSHPTSPGGSTMRPRTAPGRCSCASWTPAAITCPASMAWTGWTSIALRRCSVARRPGSRSRFSSASRAVPPPRGHLGAAFPWRSAPPPAMSCPGSGPSRPAPGSLRPGR
jgi:hypothetical protein